MNIGESIRTIVVEPLEVPVDQPAAEPDPKEHFAFLVGPPVFLTRT